VARNAFVRVTVSGVGVSRAWSLPSRTGHADQQEPVRAHRRKSVVLGEIAPHHGVPVPDGGATGWEGDIDDLPVYWERPAGAAATGTVTLTDATRTLLRGVSDLAAKAGELTRPDGDTTYGAQAPYPTVYRDPVRSAATTGWPHRGSTVVRVVHCCCGDVISVVRSRRRWERLAIDRWMDPTQAFDVALSARGRLRIPWSAVSVPVLLRVTPFLGARTMLELMVTSRGRFPRRFWGCGHDAIGAIARRCREADLLPALQ
jgi:hypothetical protein